MADASQIKFGYGTPPATPAAGYSAIYFKADKKLYAKDDAGVETQLAFGTGTADLNAFTQKQAVRVATTQAGALATAYANGQVVDGVALVTGDRILLKNQAAPAENGIYTVNAVGAPTRASDADAPGELTGGAVLFVREGTLNAGTAWQLTTTGAITLGVTALLFARAGLPKSNFVAGAAPTTADGQGAGYDVGSLWLWDNVDLSRAYILAGFDAGDAIWREIDRAVGPANAVYVTTTGNDTLGRRGDPSRPFLTVKAGLAACQNGDMLVIGPGTFSMGAGATPVWPAGVNRLTIVGAGCEISGQGGTVILNTANDGSHIFSPPNTATYVEIRDLFAQVTAGTGRALHCDGTGAAGGFLGGAGFGNGGLKLRRCVLLGTVNSVRLRFVGIADVEDVIFSFPGGGSLTEILTSNLLRCYDSWFDATQVTWDNASGDKPTIGRIGASLRSCSFGTVACGGQADITALYCEASEVNGSLTLSANGTLAPRIDFSWSEVNVVDFNTAGYEYPDTANNKTCRFDHAKINSSLKVKVAGAAANRLRAEVRNAVLSSSAGAVEAAAGVDLILRNSQIPVDGANLVTSGTGAVEVDRIARTYTTDGTSTDTFNISSAVALTFTGPPGFVLMTPRDVALGDVACTVRTATQLTIQYQNAVVQPVDVLSMWN